MRNLKSLGVEAQLSIKKEIKVESAWPPTFGSFPAETLFRLQETIEELFRGQAHLQERAAVEVIRLHGADGRAPIPTGSALHGHPFNVRQGVEGLGQGAAAIAKVAAQSYGDRLDWVRHGDWGVSGTPLWSGSSRWRCCRQSQEWGGKPSRVATAQIGQAQKPEPPQ